MQHARGRLSGRAGIGLGSLTVLLAAMLSAPPGESFAAANRIYDQGASATAQSAAFVAQADDASAVYYNPAGMTQLRRVQTSFGVTLIGGSSEFHNAAGATVESSFDGSVAYPPPSQFYATANLPDLGLTKLGDLSVGFGVITPFGTLMRWSDSGPFNTARTFASLELIDFKPTVAYKINDQLSVGLGADVYTFLDFIGEGQLERRSIGAGVLAPAGSSVELGADGTAAGFNVSLMYTPFRTADGKPLANVGLVYRSQATFHLEGDILVDGVELTGFKQTVVLPQVLTGGIALWPIRDDAREWKLELDVDYTGWKSIRNLDLTLSDGTNIPSPQDWKSTFSILVGTEYKLLGPSFLPEWDVAFRAGYWFSQTPVPDRSFNPEIPDSDNHSLSFGVGFLCKGAGRFFGLIQCGGSESPWAPKAIGLNTAFQLLLYEPRTVSGNVNPTVDGDYSTTFFVGAVNLRVNY